MVATAIYSVTMVLWKETAFPLCRAIEKRSNNIIIIMYTDTSVRSLTCRVPSLVVTCCR